MTQSTNEHPDPYIQLLAEWQEDARLAEYYKARENDKRRLLFAGAFPNPVEGTQRHTLPDGRVIVGSYKVNRKIDEAAIAVTIAAMRDRGVANADALVRYKPELAKREWNALSAEMKLVFSAAIISTPGMPDLEVVMPKGK